MTGDIVIPAELPPRGRAPQRRLGRTDRSALGTWFWEIDRVLLLLVMVLISAGLIAVAAASPASAQRYSGGSVTFPPLYFFWRQLAWVALSLPVMLIVSMLPKTAARRLSLGMAAFFTVMLAAVPLIGVEVNGAQRWIGVGVGQFQPSEFLKPVFAVSLAWLFSLKAQDADLPIFPLSAILTGLIAFLLMKQPDFGQTIVFVIIWLSLLLLAGVSARIMAGLVGLGLVGVAAAYLFYPVATQRIDNFLFAGGDTYQTDMAHATMSAGGIFGVGPGAGEAKFRLPEAHTDYIFSVIGEEFGLIACLAVALLFLAIIVRVCVKLLEEEDVFLLFASAGLVTQFGAQALINMAVNVQIAPSKGMTLPFISYGGSSMLALAIGMGLLLAFTRRNPYLTRSPYVVKWSSR